jgi:formylglycine-generating enzyme required for sulfatase activity
LPEGNSCQWFHLLQGISASLYGCFYSMPDFTIPLPLIEHLNRGDCVLFVGDALDGVSQSAHLAQTLVDAANLHADCPIPGCQENHACQKAGRCAVSLAHAAQLYEARNYRQALEDFILRRLDATPPSPLHRALAELPVRVMVSTAYDDRLCEALRLVQRPTLHVIKDTDVPFDDPKRVQLIRLHGSASQHDSLLLTEDDQADLFSRLPLVTKILQAHFASKTLLFIGYGLNDPHFLALYRQVTGPIARYQRLAYAVQWPPDELAAERWRGKITMLPVEPLKFVKALTREIRLETVRQKQKALPAEPYKFLEFYTEDDAAIFFGRDLEADLLLSAILAQRLSVFYGRSGTGKTSLLCARVLPRLKVAGYRLVYARMLGDPGDEIKAAFSDLRPAELSAAVRSKSLRTFLTRELPPGRRIVIVLDQFEEFFLRQGEQVQANFAAELADCLMADDLDLHFVLSLRDDYLGALDKLKLAPALPVDVFANRFRLENLTREKAELAMIGPAEQFGLPIEMTLRRTLLDELEDRGLETASLQIVLDRLYQDALTQRLWDAKHKQGTGLTLARCQALGGVKEILAGYLDQVLADLGSEEKRQAARLILKSMVTASQTKAAVSGQEIARSDLVQRSHLPEETLDAALRHLREARVVRKFGEEDRFELAHEVMVEKVWGWVSEEELHLFEIRDMLRRAQSDYDKFGHLLEREKLELVNGCRDGLSLDAAALELLLYSSLAAGYETPYWFERACLGGVDASDIVLAGLKSENFRTRAAAVQALARLAQTSEVCKTSDVLEALRDRLADLYPQVRLAAITVLEKLQPTGEWRKSLKYECYVPAGEFIMGDNKTGKANEKPAHKVYLDAYYIAKYPVTNAEYQRFRQDIGQPFRLPVGKEDHPVVEVSWYDARDYAAWAGMGLLSEAQWEKAASWNAVAGQRPAQKRIYPWGNAFDKNKCNTSKSGTRTTTPVGKYSPQGDSPYGAADMVGNVWEWLNDWYADDYYKKSPVANPPGPESCTSKVLRGGSWYHDVVFARCACRDFFVPRYRYDYLGFRVGWQPENH